MSANTTIDDLTELLDLVQEAGQVGVLEWDLRTGRVRTTRHLLALYGLEEFDGRYERLNESVLPEDVPELAKEVDRAIAQHARDVNIEFRIVRQNDQQVRWIESRNLIFYGDDGRAMRLIGVNADVTERKRAISELQQFTEVLEERVRERTRQLEAENDARRQAEEALRQAQKLEGLGQLTGGVAHDFNNLLTIIKASTDLLRRPDLAPERRRRYIDAIAETVDRAAKVTGQLLAFARRTPLKPEVFNVGERLQSITEMLRALLGSHIEIVLDLPDQPCLVLADLSQFETVIVNMAVNARDAMAGVGTLSLGLAVRQGPEQLHHLEQRDFAAITIRDTGTGIPSENLHLIFEPFFTTKGVGKGTGLGLSQVYGFAKQSEGDIQAESEVGRGTSFTLYLPLATGEETRRSTISAPSTSTTEPDRSRRVLVVEDNLKVGGFAKQLIEDLGYQTSWANDGAQALELMITAGPFDIVFSDVMMPGMSGIELAREVANRYPGTPVILTSGYSEVLSREGTRGFELLRKPYAAEELSRVLRRAVRARD